MLAVFFEVIDNFVDLGRVQSFEVDGFFDAVVEGGDGSGVAIFAFPDSDSGWTFPDVFVVVGDILAA